jgi:hypothetical protein
MRAGPIEGSEICGCGCGREPARCDVYQAARAASDRQRWADSYERWKRERKWITPTTRRCLQCQRPFTARTGRRGQPNKFCTVECRKRHEVSVRRGRRNGTIRPATQRRWKDHPIRPGMSPEALAFIGSFETARTFGEAMRIGGFHIDRQNSIPE